MTGDREATLAELLIRPWATAKRVWMLAFDPAGYEARYALLGDEHESVAPDPRSIETPPRGRSYFASRRTPAVWDNVKSALKAVLHWFAFVFLPWLWRLAVRVAECAWALAVAFYEVFRDQVKATGSTLSVVNGADVKRAAATAATSTGLFSCCVVLMIVALHGASAVVAVLPLGIPGDVVLFLIHFFLTLAVRLNHGKDPLAE